MRPGAAPWPSQEIQGTLALPNDVAEHTVWEDLGGRRRAFLGMQNSENGFPFMMKVHAAGSRVRGKLASSAAGAPSIRLTAHYHYY